MKTNIVYWKYEPNNSELYDTKSLFQLIVMDICKRKY